MNKALVYHTIAAATGAVCAVVTFKEMLKRANLKSIKKSYKDIPDEDIEPEEKEIDPNL